MKRQFSENTCGLESWVCWDMVEEEEDTEWFRDSEEYKGLWEDCGQCHLGGFTEYYFVIL